MIGNGQLRVLPPGEIDYSGFPDIQDRLCTYESNVDPTSLEFQLAAPKMQVELSAVHAQQLEKIVIAAYQAIGCRDYARMDVLLHCGIL